MSDRIETVITEALLSCGIEDAEKVEVPAILAALKAARIAVVDMESADCDDVHSGDSRGHLIFVELDPGEPIEVSPEFARQIAAALLAAADAAESAAVGARITAEEA